VGRTDLSWQRTGLGVLGVAGLIGHRAVVNDRPALLVVAGVAALLGLCLLGGLAPARSRQLLRRRAVGAEVTAPLLVAAATGVVVLVALAAAVAVVTL
jgi:putative membrane protein